jgi:frataxin
MDERAYHEAADAVLAQLEDRFEAELEVYELEVEYRQGVLSVTKDTHEWVINKHAPTKQIWVASPISGASYYAYIDGVWRGVRDQSLELTSLLLSEIMA